MSIAPGAVVTMPRGVRLHFDKVRDGWVLLAPERAISLDPIGHAILSAIDGTRNFAGLTGYLAEKYEAPVEQISTDCAEFIVSLRDRRMLDVSQ